ncbi:MAG: glycerol-3-phosphate 1-O-acyltransferase PlsY [Rhizobiaceae bacterium]|nr:glycerol-3-phosphate 1-O-acyltransferase PlsY [Rhizobiaceae bacterium]
MPDPISWSLALPYFLYAIAFGYVIGSVPFGLIFTRMAGLGDIRKIGSGNIGATNVLRTGNIPVALATVVADILKGTFAYMIVENYYGIDMALMAGLGAFLGHCFSIWLKFKGGKAVATYVGILLPISIKVALIFAMLWITVAALTRHSSMASLIAAMVTPPSLYILGYPQAGELFVLLTIIVVIKHRGNIKRLLNGTEDKIGSS